VLVYALAANGSQTGEGNNQGQVQRSPQNVKTAAPATQRVMVLKLEIVNAKSPEVIFWHFFIKQ
jgi:hypothetical protein